MNKWRVKKFSLCQQFLSEQKAETPSGKKIKDNIVYGEKGNDVFSLYYSSSKVTSQ